MRTLLFVLLGLCLAAGAAAAATHYAVPGNTMTSPLYDNAGTCAAPVDIPVPAGTPRMLHRRIVQSGATVLEDSTAAGAGAEASFAEAPVPGPAACTVTYWPSDAGGAGCPTTFQAAPVARAYPPAALAVRPLGSAPAQPAAAPRRAGVAR